MTPLTKPVTRRSETVIRDGGTRRRLVVTIYPNDTVGLRPERTRREERITLDAVYACAIKARVRHEQAEKRAKKKARRK